jgi:hypothetical protein
VLIIGIAHSDEGGLRLVIKKNKNSLDLMCSYVYLLTVVPGSNTTKYETNIKLVRFQTAQGVQYPVAMYSGGRRQV